jgi:hypothetical protein
MTLFSSIFTNQKQENQNDDQNANQNDDQKVLKSEPIDEITDYLTNKTVKYDEYLYSYSTNIGSTNNIYCHSYTSITNVYCTTSCNNNNYCYTSQK